MIRTILAFGRLHSFSPKNVPKTPTPKTISRINQPPNSSVPILNAFSLSSTRNFGLEFGLKQKNQYTSLSVGGVRHYCYHGPRSQFRYQKLNIWYKQNIGGLWNLLFVTAAFGSLGFGIVMTIRLGHWETIPYSKRTHLVLLSTTREKEVGDEQLDEEKKKFKGRILPSDHPDSVRVRSISNEVIAALQRDLKIEQVGTVLGFNDELVNQQQSSSHKKLFMTKHLEGLTWEVLVVDKDDFNAFCLPGGKIVVYTGLLKHLKSDAEIATVIGHEVAHVVARHAAENYAKYLWFTIIQIVLICLASFNGGHQRSHTNTDNIKGMTKFLLELPFSRRMEREADYIGLLLIASAGYDPRVAPMMYEMFDKVDGNSSKSDYFSTHPSGKKRAKSLAKAKVMEEAMSKYRLVRQGVEGFYLLEK